MDNDFLLAVSLAEQQELLKSNEFTSRFGLCLTQQEIDLCLLRFGLY